MSQITIRTGTFAEAVALSKQLPEFSNPYPESVYFERIGDRPYLVLIALDQEIPAGFKVGYQKENDGSFYSWMGGIIPQYRRRGIAKELAEIQEAWATEQGYRSIKFKTRNRHKNMLTFALLRGFDIIDFLPEKTIGEHRILLEKSLVS